MNPFLLLLLTLSLTSVQAYAADTNNTTLVKKYAYKTLVNEKDNPKAVQTFYKDLDQDGVADRIDHCLNTGIGYPVDQYGCEADSDQDGVYDSLDQCPHTPKGRPVNFLGCEGDQDRDGVLDSKDKCPNTPLGTRVNAQGCPSTQEDPDKDQDGILNEDDLCPQTPLGDEVNVRGCTPHSVVVFPIEFDSGKFYIKNDQKPILDRSAASLAQLSKGKIILVTGHTDSQGSTQGNEKLSWNRAYTVKQYLIKNFNYQPDQIYITGKGESQPIADNSTEAGRAKNRRIEFKIIDEGELPTGVSKRLPKEMSDYRRYIHILNPNDPKDF